ncbi:MAG TPA: RluA family pseudouridine synthase [Saprospiraceae bacterium]|nr:RluA family pseudouridine synthase [Saprospiraceae bacterium]
MKPNQQIEIIYIDDHIIVVNKPAGFLSIPDRFDANKPSVSAFLKSKYQDIFVLHRLDKDTSGIMIFGRTAEDHKHLSNQFEKHSLKKKYLALVEGFVLNDSGKIDKPIGESKASGGQMIITPKGKQSITLYKVLKRFKKYSLVEADILTGRMHQIRVHFKSIGHPLAIDAMYGNRTEMFISDIKTKKLSVSKFEEEKPIMTRTTLHAFALEFRHPSSLEEMRLEAPPHKDMKALLTQLEKWD